MEKVPNYLEIAKVNKNLRPWLVRVVIAMLCIKERLGGFPDDIEWKIEIETKIDQVAIKKGLGRLRKLHVWRQNDLDMEMLELVCRTKYRFVQLIAEVAFNHPAIRAEKARLGIGDIGADEPMGEMIALRLSQVYEKWADMSEVTVQLHMEIEVEEMIGEGILIETKPAKDLAKEIISAISGRVLKNYSVGFAIRPE